MQASSKKTQFAWMELDTHKRHYHVGYGKDSETIVPLGFDVTNCDIEQI